MKPIDILRRSRVRARRISPLGERRAQEIKYRRSILAVIRQSQQRVDEVLFGSDIIQDTPADELREAFRNLRELDLGLASTVTDIVQDFALNANNAHKKRFNDGLARSFGVDVQGILTDEGLEDILQAAIEENVSLIKSIPNEYYDKVEQAVFRQLRGGGGTTGLQGAVKNIKGSSVKRAKLIARDQNAKLNATLNKVRQENLGVEEYIWVTSKDDRVRQTHRDNNGKTFRWDTPSTETGHPGDDIQCRCIAQPVI